MELTQGMRIEIARRNAEKTRQEMAELLGVSDQTIRNWEANIHIMPLDKAVEFCTITGISLQELTGDKA